ncbi:MAG: hypothetical protein L7S57_07315, partial [Luminiphilus sp.]|nr:hypothetical protein [Luminiphilus sp.]
NDGANLANHSGFLIGMPGDNGATPFDFYFTDVSVSGVSYPSAVVADVYYSLDGTTWESDYSNLSLAQGTNTVSFKQVDEAGNESAVQSVTFEYDDVTPTLDSIADTSGVSTDVDTTAHQFTVSFSEPVDPGSVSPANFVAAGPGASIVSVAGVGAMVDGGYTTYNIGVTGSGEGVLSLALNTAVTFADIAGNAGDSFTAGVTDVTGELAIDTVHPTVTGIERVPESDTGLPGGDTNADVLVYKVGLSQAIDGSTIDGGDFEITARDLGGALVAIDDATLTVRSGAAADAAVVNGGEHAEVYVHVQSATLAGLDGDAKLVLASADPVPVEQNLYSSDNTENGNVNWGGLTGFNNGAIFDAGVIDPTHGQVFSVASGEGYGPGVNSGFVAFTNWGNPAGFEVMETFSVKVKDLPTDVLEIKMITGAPTPDSVAQVNISDTTISQDLGDGWHQLTIPADRFSNPEHLSTHSGWLIGHPGDTGATPFEFYFTDVSVGSTQYPAGADFADPNGNLVDASGRLTTEVYDLDNSITAPSVDAIAVDNIVNIAEDGLVAITLSGGDTDIVTTTVQVTAASNIDAVTGLPIDPTALVAATGSGNDWTVDTNTVGADGDYVVLVGALDDAGNVAGSTASFNLDTQITAPSVVNTIAIDNIVNNAENGTIDITLGGGDADIVTTTVQVTAASNIDAVTGLPIDPTALVAATGSGDSWTIDTTTVGADGNYVVLVGAMDDASNIAGSMKSFRLDTVVEALEGIELTNDTNAQVTTAPEHMLFSGDGNHDGAMWNGVDTFGNGATFDATVTDADHGQVFKVTSGEGYGPSVQVAFAAFTGHAPGFVEGYDVFNAKVKGSPDGMVEVKLLGGAESVATVDTATYPGSIDLGGGWYELSIPFTDFSNSDAANMAAHTGWLIGPPGDQADAPFDFFFTDVGFAGDRITSDGSLTAPTNVEVSIAGAPVDIDQNLYSSDNAENGGVNWGGLNGFGNGATFDAGVIDPVHGQVFHVASGEGYAAGVNSGFAAFTGAFTGVDAYNTFNVKVTDTPSGVVEVKLIGGTDSVVHVTLANDPNATALGDGWYELSIPFSQFSNNDGANLANHSGFLIGMPGDNGATPFDFYFTDVSVSGMGFAETAYTDGLSARDFLSIGQNLATLTDVNDDAVVGIDSGAVIKVGLDWDDAGTTRSPLTELGKGELTAVVSATDVLGNTDASGAAVDYVDPDFTLDEYAAALEGIELTNDTNAQVTTAPEHMLFSGDGNHDG